MAKSTPKHLKVYTEQPPEVHSPGIEGVHSLADVCQAVECATGWSVRYVAGPAPRCGRSSPWSTPVNRGCGIAAGHLELEASLATSAGQKAAIAEDSVRQLVSAVAGMLGELLQTQHVLWQREAELAAGVPLVPARDEANHLAVRLEAVLKGGAEAVGGQAAALYLLDEDTSHLKLRSCWGLSRDRFLDPARPLRGAIADLEALLGNAVVLEDTQRMQPWKSPEEGYAAAACVPIATSTTLLGTFWVFSTTARDFDDQQTNLLEIVAGRLAADLEREMLLREGIDGAKLKRQLAAAERLQQDQLPAIAPQVEGWDLAGWATQAQTLGGGFFDWFCLDDGRLAITLGSAAGRGMESALTAAAARTAIRCHAQRGTAAEQVLAEVNRTLWTGSTGSQHVGLFFGLLDPQSGDAVWSSAGPISIVAVDGSGWRSLSQASSPAGHAPDTIYRPCALQLRPDEAIVVCSEGVVAAADPRGGLFGEAGLAEGPRALRDRPATEQCTRIRGLLETYQPGPARADRVVLVAHRRATAHQTGTHRTDP
jgi:serine phosphatase RsbU (regulator of sigma subunit)